MNKILKYGLIGVALLLIVNAGAVVYDIKQELVSSIASVREQTNIRLNYLDNQSSTLSEIAELTVETNDNQNKSVGHLTHAIQSVIDRMYEVEPDYIIRGSVYVQSLMGSGSGTVLKKTSDAMYILTCYHVIAINYRTQQDGVDIGVVVGYTKQDDADKIGGLILYGASIIKVDEENDLALLKLNIVDDELNEIKLSTQEPIRGDIAFAVGCPLGSIRTISRGIVANKVEGFVVFDGLTTFGNSGGGLYNSKGELIGVPARVPVYTVIEEENGDSIPIPESNLGESINLKVIREFLKDSEIKV